MLKIVVAVVSGFMLTGCVSLTSLTSDSAPSGDPIVMAAGGKAPIIAKLDREAWVQIRKNGKDEEKRLYTALGTGDFEVAKEEARAYLLKHPKNRTALVVLSTAFAMQKDFRQALYYGELVQRYHPGSYDSELANLRGLAALYKPRMTYADYAEASSHFNASFQASRTQTAAGLNLGHVQLLMGSAAAAESTFKQVEGRCGGCVDSQIGYGIALTRQRKYDKAKEVFAQILNKHPNHILAMYRLALIEKNGYNNEEEAKDYLKKILADNSSSSLDVKRQANTLLHSMQAMEVGREIAEDSKDEEPSVKPVAAQESEESEAE
jgi:tetratricopeptide (TPR) repeat protein